MTPEAIIEAFARGLVKAFADVPAASAPIAPPPTVAGAPEVIPARLPTPSFDQAADEGQLPLIPPATLRDMEQAMESIRRGNGVHPDFYEPGDADTRVPLS